MDEEEEEERKAPRCTLFDDDEEFESLCVKASSVTEDDTDEDVYSLPKSAAVRRNLTNAQRRAICREKIKRPQITQIQLAAWAMAELSVPHVTQATISNILSRSDEYLHMDEKSLEARRRRSKRCTDFEKALLKRVLRYQKRKRRALSNARIMRLAKRAARKHPENTPPLSEDWVSYFRRRHSGVVLPLAFEIPAVRGYLFEPL